ncbi:MAG: terminase [Hyphomicrobiales bacterium]|nr:terminase [Hyphomicrobiales bacterium]
MVTAAQSKRTDIENLNDQEYRLNHLYWIQDKHGNVTKFHMNASQHKLFHEMHYLNIILKARQLGFSTFILILALDCCLFNSNFNAGLVADTLDNAKNLLKRIKFAYENLEPDFKEVIGIKADNATDIEFTNNSWIEVGVSLRSGTKNFVHISEYGKICAKAPEKAKEIRSGTLNTLAKGQLGFIESTAEGRGGDFYDKTTQSRNIADSGREPEDMEYKFHFFPWYDDEEYQLSKPVTMTSEEKRYFKSLVDEHGIELTDGQKWWYSLKSREQAEDMWKEYPSTADEAFAAARDGAYFANDIRALRQRGKIGKLEYESRTPVNTFWDLGVGDSTVIWLHQLIAGRHRFVGHYKNSGEGIEHYLDWLDRWRAVRGAVFGTHYGPHDIEHRKQITDMATGQLITIKSVAAGLGYDFEVVVRSAKKQNSIQAVRSILPDCEFDESETSDGIIALENYSKEWDEKGGTWKSNPLHNKYSHDADAFMTFADGWDSDTGDDEFEQPSQEWVL